MQAHFVTKFCLGKKHLRCVAKVTSARRLACENWCVKMKTRHAAGPFRMRRRSVSRHDRWRYIPAEAVVQAAANDMALLTYGRGREAAGRRREVGEGSADGRRLPSDIVIKVLRFDRPIVPDGIFEAAAERVADIRLSHG